MDPKPLALCAGVAALLLASPARAADDPLAADLRAVVERQVAAFNAKDVPAALATLHTKSPEYRSTEEELVALFKDENLSASLASFQYVGHDDEFAVARVKLRVGAPAGDEFVDNTSDTMTLFHQEDGAWRIWGDYLIGVQTLEPIP